MSKPEWSPEALALFAEYAPHREPHRPLECDQGAVCWVRDGPPSIAHVGTGGQCTGCRGTPRSPLNRPGRVRWAKR